MIDYNGIRDEARAGQDDLASYIAEAITDYLEGRSAHRHVLRARQFSVLGYRIAMRMLKTERTLDGYVEAFSHGFELALLEYSKSRLNYEHDVTLDRFDRLEQRARDLLRRATHEGTGEHEAAASALALAKHVVKEGMSVVAPARYHEVLIQYTKLRHSIEYIKKQYPWLVLWAPG